MSPLPVAVGPGRAVGIPRKGSQLRKLLISSEPCSRRLQLFSGVLVLAWEAAMQPRGYPANNWVVLEFLGILFFLIFLRNGCIIPVEKTRKHLRMHFVRQNDAGEADFQIPAGLSLS
jgi:hypothetical protein